ncbi:hypothetical protein I2I05_19845 [Hymenobacter sp. BT683]|uniref:STAS/SEC14 domain-containing protein n=1 Tax=Hymenobacter jeongseonensis TaxID=2791027 RepID=A0ABS0IMR4_9BACT|nr:hypothetical protein [Hymenobacter jeongseonensis]MBF9239656.1 hypothetical protein [Hymenobacter jeongseonensis]
MLSPTTPKLYFENKAGRLLEHPDGYVVLEYKPGPRQFTDLQALLAHVRNLLERNRWHRLLGDQRLMAPFSEQERAWIVEYWLDRSRQRAGGIHSAVILAHDVFARLSMDQVTHAANVSALTYRVFDTEEAAAAWLGQVT